MKRWFRHQHVIFDCDSTLSKIEGIDELAKFAGVSAEVKAMTDAAMTGEIELEEVYGKRLELICPTQDDIVQLKHAYKNTATEHAKEVIELLKQHGHDIYIVSGGLLEPVAEFGIAIGIKAENIRAVGVEYNQLSDQWWLNQSAQAKWSSEYLNFHQNPLTLSEGKKTIINELVGDKSGRKMLIGDGMSDLLAATEVDSFIGYGGVENREKVRLQSQVFIECESLSPLIALAGGQPLVDQLKTEQHTLLDAAKTCLSKRVMFADQDSKNYLLNLFN